MGLHVGVAKIEYLQQPREPVLGFLWQLAEEVGNESWGGSWEGNAFVECQRRRVISKARRYARQQNLSQQDTDNLTAWVRGLPWDGNTVMLHLDW